MSPHSRTLPSLFSLSRQSPLLRCRRCFYSTSAKPNVTNAHTILSSPTNFLNPSWRPTNSLNLSSRLHEREEKHALVLEQRTRKATDRADAALVDDYILKLEGGELIDGSRWDTIFVPNAFIPVPKASRLLKFAREAKILTPNRYFTFLMHLLRSNEFVAAQIALNTMIQDGLHLTNWHLEQLLDHSTSNYSLFFRFLSLMDLDAWDYPIAIPRITYQTTRMLESFYSALSVKKADTRLSHIMTLVPHMNSKMLEALVTSTREPYQLEPAFVYIVNIGALPTMNIYEHFCKFLRPYFLPQVYQHMKHRGLIPTNEIYHALLTRYKKLQQEIEFPMRLIEDMKSLNIKYTYEGGLIAIELSLLAKNLDMAFYVAEKILAGPFTQVDHHYVTQAIGKYSEGFQGTPYESKFTNLLVQTLAIPKEQFILPRSDKVLPEMDDEW